ncbi:MAG TPA: LptF/LptG family permease [Candidatus Kapabacteria bacterium]|nr:LptF/LptG family permease [Candidatus Kapabacteria bacterium]
MKLIDRYIVKSFLMTLSFSIIALCIIFIIVNLLERLDDFLDQNAGIYIIVKYYVNFLPAIIQILLPLASLLATLFTFGRMSTLNEIIAMKSGGVSLYRFMLPVVIISVMISCGHLYFNGWLVPAANKAKNKIELKYLNINRASGPIYNLYFRDSPTTNILMQYYDAPSKTGNRVSIEYYTEEFKPRLKKRIDCSDMRWDSLNNQWIMNNVIIREYDSTRIYTERLTKAPIKISVSYNQIEKLQNSTDEMDFNALKDYINLLSQGGKDVRLLLIDYYGKWAFPFANIIVILFGVPFASIKRKGGIAIQIGAAMVVSFTYMIFTKVSQTISFAYGIDPILAGWIANIIFLIIGIITILRTRT